LIKDHVLLQFACDIEAVDLKMSALITPEVIRRIVDLIPDDWLEDDPAFTGETARQDHRRAYEHYLVSRLEAPRAFVEEAVRARSVHL
jgi:hypothetical protein